MFLLNTEPRPRIHLVRDPFDDSDRFNKKERLMFDINFTRNGEILNCYQAGHPVHKWFLDPMDAGTPDAGPFRENRALIDIHGRGTYDLYAVGMPFWGIHGFNGAYPVFGCRSTFYAIGVRQAAANFNVMIVSSKGPVSFGHCNHQLDLEEGRMSSTWMPLVQLSGWQRVDSTQGTVMAISPQGTRIATANWDCVLVWTLNPTLLHRQGLKRSLPTRDYDPRKGIGRLRPSKLPTVGVVYRMMWTSEESLYATTEYGLVQWNLGVWGSKRREKISMDHVPCPEPANT